MTEPRETSPTVVTLAGDRLPEVVDALHEAFYDYPVMRYVLGERSGYDADLRTLIRLFVLSRHLRGEWMFGVEAADGRSGLEGVAVASRPDGRPAPVELDEVREHTWRTLGGEARVRYEAFGAACAPFQVDAPHLHLNMVGVRPRAQGTGVGRLLVERVHRLSSEDAASTGVTLTTENPANVTLYQHLGYRVVGQAVVSPSLRTWGFFRPN